MKTRRLWLLCGWLGIWQAPGYSQVITLRDPTQPVIPEHMVEIPKDNMETVYVLQSIIISPSRKLALINDKYVRVGDMIGEAKVEAIEKNYVILLQAGRKQTIYLFDLGNWEKN